MNLLFKLLNSIESRYCQHSIKPSTTSRDFPSFQNTYRYRFLHRRLSSLLESGWRRVFCEKTPEFFWAAPRYMSRPKKVCPAEMCRERSPLHLLLTAPPDDLAAGPSTSPEHRPSVRKSDSPDVAATVPWISKSSPIYWSKNLGWVSSQPIQ